MTYPRPVLEYRFHTKAAVATSTLLHPALSNSAMFRGKSMFALLATIFNLIIPLIDGAYLEERPASNDLAEIMNNDMAEIMSTAFPLKGNNPPAVSGTLTAAPPNCTPWAKCILFFQVSDVPVGLNTIHT